MSIKERASRCLALAVGLSLASASFGAEAWAGIVPLVDRVPTPIDGPAPMVRVANSANALDIHAAGAEGLGALPQAASVDVPAALSVSAPDAAESAAQAPEALPETSGTSALGPLSTRQERTDSRARWDSHKDIILSHAQALKDRLDDKARRRELEIGADSFKKEIDKSKINDNDPKLGKAEMTLVDGRRFIRVVHSPSELSFLFLDVDAVSRDSRHLRQIIARQFFDAGSDRTDGRRGRNTVVVWQKEGRTIESEFNEKPAFPSAEWWRQYWRATYKAPTLTTVRFGLVMGTLQGVLALGVAEINLLQTGTPISLAPVVFTTVFGTLIGAYMSFYRNWTYRGSPISQLLKSALISIAFAYPVILFTKGFASLTLMGNAMIFFNVSLNNAGKVAWQGIPRMFEKYQHYLSSRPLFWGFKVGDLMNQGFYLINWTLRLIALLIPTWLGYGPMFLGMGVGIALTYWYAKSHGYPEAAQMLKAPGRMLERVQNALKRLFH